MTPQRPHWVPGWLTIGIAGAAGFLLGVVVLVVARGVVHDTVRTVTQVKTRTIEVRPTVPNVVGLTVAEAESRLTGAGYQADVRGGGFFGVSDGDTIASQDPAEGTELPGGSTVVLQAE